MTSSARRRLFACALWGLAAPVHAGAGAAVATPSATPPAPAGEAVFIAEPPAARPGECWSLVVVPAQFERRVESVLRTPAGEKTVRKPARYATVEREVELPAGQRRVVVEPAQYETVSESVLVRPARTRTITAPGEYRQVEQRIPLRQGAALKPNPDSGELCVVEAPVEYRIETRRELVKAGESRVVEEPAVYRRVERRRLVREARTELVERPARTVRRRERVLVEPESVVTEPTPAVYEDVVHLVQVAPARNQWRSVLCETNATPALLGRVQAALKAAGHDPGRTDGRWTARSTRAIQAFQAGAGLAPAGLTMETLERLGVAPGG